MRLIGGICFVLLLLVLLGVGSKKRRRSVTVVRAPVAPPPKVIFQVSTSTATPFGYQQTEDDEAFEQRIEETFGEKVDKHFYSRVAGVTFPNEDGVNRQSLIVLCKPFDRIMLVREPENPHGATAIRVTNADGAKLGYLPRERSGELSWQIDRSHREWIAVARHVAEHKIDGHFALILCLLRIALPPDTSDGAVFEKGFEERFEGRYDQHFHAPTDRGFGLNEDGSERQDLVTVCERYQELSLHREPLNERDANSIQIRNGAGECLAYLERRIAAEIAPQMDAGRLWSAIVHHVEPTPAGKKVKLHVCVCRAVANK